jgi:hypothetical protein
MSVIKYDKTMLLYEIEKYIQEYADGKQENPTVQDFAYKIRIPMRGLNTIMKIDDEINDAMMPLLCVFEKYIMENVTAGQINHQTAAMMLKQPIFGYVDKSLIIKDESGPDFDLTPEECEKIAAAPADQVAAVYKELIAMRERS